MDEQTALMHKLSRQLRVFNLLMVFFTIIFIAAFVVGGFFAYQAWHKISGAIDQVNSLKTSTSSNINVKNELCNSGGTLETLLKTQSNVCN